MCLAVPGRITEISGSDELREALVDFGGVSRQVNLAFLPEAETDDYVLVHVGFAIAVVDEQLAAESAEMLSELGPALPLVPPSRGGRQ